MNGAADLPEVLNRCALIIINGANQLAGDPT